MASERIFLDALRASAHAPTKGFTTFPENVWKRTSALNTWGTNAIEGNTLSHDDVEQLLLEEESVSGRPVRDVVETLQHEQAFRSLPGRVGNPIDLVTTLDLHAMVFRGIPRVRAGQWRTSNVFIAGTKHRPPRAEKLLGALNAWSKEYAKRAKRGHPLDVAAWMHHAFEAIHPFEDGNGRVGRLLLNLHLLANHWPVMHILPPDRDRYLAALEAGNDGDLAPLTRYFETLAMRSLLDLLDQIGGAREELRPLAAFDGESWNPYGAAYLALRCRQEALPAIPAYATTAPAAHHRRPGRPRWLTSERALRWYVRERGR